MHDQNQHHHNIYNLLFKTKNLSKVEEKFRTYILYNHLLKNEDGKIIKHDKDKLFESKIYMKVAKEIEQDEELEEEFRLFNEKFKIHKSSNHHEHKHILKHTVNRIEISKIREFLKQLKNKEIAVLKTFMPEEMKKRCDRFNIALGKNNQNPNLEHEDYERIFTEKNYYVFGHVIKNTLFWTVKLHQLAFVIVELKKAGLIETTSINNAVDLLLSKKKVINIGEKKDGSLKLYSRIVESASYKKKMNLDFFEPTYVKDATHVVKKLIDVVETKKVF